MMDFQIKLKQILIETNGSMEITPAEKNEIP